MSEFSSCYYCRQVFETERIEEWLDGGRTPVCPLCGVDCLDSGEASPTELLQRYRLSFGHPPDDGDLPELQGLQRLSERLTAGEEVGSVELLESIAWRARLMAASGALAEDEEAYGRLWVALFGVDSELKCHRERFLALDPAACHEAWRASDTGVEHMPYWCRPKDTPGPTFL